MPQGVKSVGLDLGAELHELDRAIGAAHQLAESLVQGSLPDEPSERAAPACIAGTLSLVMVRLRDLGRVLRGELDPSTAIAPFNRADDIALPDSLVLPAWDDHQQVSEAERVLQRVRLEQRPRRRRGRGKRGGSKR